MCVIMANFTFILQSSKIEFIERKMIQRPVPKPATLVRATLLMIRARELGFWIFETVAVWIVFLPRPLAPAGIFRVAGATTLEWRAVLRNSSSAKRARMRAALASMRAFISSLLRAWMVSRELVDSVSDMFACECVYVF